MTIYLVKGYLDVAATTLADAQELFTALLDPTDPDNAATIDRVTQKIETLVAADTGEPITLASIDDAAGTISSWVTDTSTTLALALGDPDPNGNANYASTIAFTIAGSTRTATLALNTNALKAAVSRGPNLPRNFTLQVRKTTNSVTETVALLPIQIRAGVLNTTPTDAETISYLQVAAARAGYVINLSAITSLTGGGATTLDGQSVGTATGFPVGCIVMTSDGGTAPIFRPWKLLSGPLAATDLAALSIKPTGYNAATPMYWQG